MKTKLKHGRILKASEVRKIESNTIWIVSCLSKNGRERFLGSYPSPGEAEQAAREEFSRTTQPLVTGYDPALLR